MFNQMQIKVLLILFIAGIFFTGCKKDSDPAPENQEELITTVKLTFINENDATDIQTFIAYDEDGDGLNIQYTNGTLKKGASYEVDIELLNESIEPVENVTLEVEEEKEEHQFYFGFPATLFDGMTYLDQDANGKPLGVQTRFVVKADATGGTFNVILVHEPNKTKNIADTPWTYNDEIGGETDVNVAFTVTVTN